MSRTWRRITLGTIAALLILVVFQLSRLKVTPPSVDGDTIRTATVKKGSMPWEVRGSGTLVHPEHSKKFIARVTVPEVMAGDVQLNQTAQADILKTFVNGHVSYISPSAADRKRRVDIALDSDLPEGTGANLPVDATIHVGKLENILYVGRPVQANPNSLIGVFKVVNGGGQAVRVNVKLGRASVNTIEVLDGLKEGDRIILSDMSAWDNFDRVRLR